MSPRRAQVLVAAAALGIAAPAAAVLALGNTPPSQFAYRSEGRVAKTARVVAQKATIDPAPIVVEETVILAERPRGRPAIATASAPAAATGAGCGAWRVTQAGPRARAAAASEVRSCDVLDPAAGPAPASATVAPRVPHPTMVFDYAIDAPN